MKNHKLYIAVGLMIAFGLFFELAAHASEANESTQITFGAPVQIPGLVLPAGTYTFQQATPELDPNLVQIFNADGTVLYATLQTVSAERAEMTSDTALTLAEPQPANPDVLVKWFYPGRLIGHEFIYSPQSEQQIAHAAQKTVVGNEPAGDTQGAGN
jgi:Protein of unknown function (DUF2911)